MLCLYLISPVAYVLCNVSIYSWLKTLILQIYLLSESEVLARKYNHSMLYDWHRIIRIHLFMKWIKRLLLALKVIRKFFLKHNKSFRWHLGDYEKHNFFPYEGLGEEKLWFFLCFYGCVVCPLKTCLYKLNGLSGRRHSGADAPAGHTIHS